MLIQESASGEGRYPKRYRSISRVVALSIVLGGVAGSATATAQNSGGDNPAAVEEPNAPVRTLAELVAAARANYPGLRAAAHRVEAAEAQLTEATYSPFFQVSADAALGIAPRTTGSPIYSRDSQLPLDNPWEPFYRVGAQAVIPLWTFGKITGLRDAAKAGVDAAKEGKDVSLAQLLFNVRRAYYSLQMSLDIQQMLDEGQGKLEDAARRLEQRIEENDPEVNELDRYRLITTIAEVRGRRSETERLEHSAHDALLALTGIKRFTVPECPLSVVEYELKRPSDYVSRAIEDRPDLAMARAGMRARHAEDDIYTAKYFPDIALALSASTSIAPGITDQSNPFIIDRGNFQSIGGAIVARWDLDLIGHWQRDKRTDAQVEETRALVDEALAGVKIEVSATYHEVVEAEQRVEAWGEGHRDAREWFVAAAQGYQIGTVDPKELIDAVKAYFSARASHVIAIMDYNTAIAKLSRVTGQDLLPEKKWEILCEE
ncbi:MAG: TolC family protein [Myxococcales bacterium]|nr:TolC family protein [Myxococcales bacterium]